MKKGLSILLLSLIALTVSAQKRVKHTVSSAGHPIAVWQKGDDKNTSTVLLVHGRTWSGVPDFDLQVDGEDLSLMDGLVENGFTAYAIDLRGYGGTARDETGWVSPKTSADDVAAVLDWIGEKHGGKPHLFGWSMGSTISLLAVNRHPEKAKSLTVFGYWMDLDQKMPKSVPGTPKMEKNTAEAAASDFITPGTISKKAVDRYVKMALEADPVKTDLSDYHHYNEIDPSKIEIPVLIMQGEFDPISPTASQVKLFTRLKTPK